MSMRSRLKRLVTLVCAVLVALGLGVGVTACGKDNSKEVIRADIQSAMEIFKNPTEENMLPYLERTGLDLDELDAYGIDIIEFCQHAFKHFDYSIDDVSVEGDKATAELTLSNVSLAKVATEVTEDVTNNIDDYADLLMGENAQQELYKAIFEKMYAALDATTETVQSNVELTYTKNDDRWVVDDESMMDLTNKLFGGLEL